jgi:hypothetical protein
VLADENGDMCDLFCIQGYDKKVILEDRGGGNRILTEGSRCCPAAAVESSPEFRFDTPNSFGR